MATPTPRDDADHRVLTLGTLGTADTPGSPAGRAAAAGGALAVLGHPIGHSLSPAMHNAALAAAVAGGGRGGLAGWRYHRIDVPPERLAEALGLLHDLGFAGVNLTIPHKVAAAALVERVDDEARGAGAVNTLLRSPSGWRGSNTDGYGLAEGVRADLGRGLGGAPVLVLGAGGAARGAALACLGAGCRGLWIANRSRGPLDLLLADLAPAAARAGVEVRAHGPGAALPAGLLVVNATSVGLRPDDPSPFDLGTLESPAGVYDMVYGGAGTRLLADARSRGIPAADGLSMLAHQGALSLQLWTGIPAAESAPVMLAAAKAALAARAAGDHP